MPRGDAGTTTPATIADVKVSPTITLTSPAPNATMAAPATITLAANAADPDGTVREVDVFRDGISIGIVRAAPFTLSWPNVTAGRDVLTARATDNGGLTHVVARHGVRRATVGVSADAYGRDGSSASSGSAARLRCP